MLMWGKDHATGVSVETPIDVVEEINLCNEEVDPFDYVVDET